MGLQIIQPELDASPLGLPCTDWEALRIGHGDTAAAARAGWVECFRDGRLPDALSSAITVRSIDADDGTIKFLIRLPDGHETESVILPLRGKNGRVRNTLCLSSQVGCAMGCTFCETAQMGLIRHLSTAEIILQWHIATHHFKHAIRNIVFMGMGEPLDNVEAVIGAIRVLVDRRGPSLGSSRIAISTVGRVDGIRRLSDFVRESECRHLRLAVSVNAADDDTRSSIMPLNRAMNMSALRSALDEWVGRHGGTLLIEYVLIPGVNDHDEAAGRLADWLGDLPVRVNVIPYNPRRDSPWPAPQESDVIRFVEALRTCNLSVHRRVTQGRSLMAACGQLGNEHIRRRKRVDTGSG